MSLFNDGMYMPVAPAYSNNGCGGWGGDAWLILIILFAMGGWGGFGGVGGGFEMPYFYNAQTQNEVSRGFESAAVSGQLNGIQSAVTNGFATAEVAACNRATDALQTAYSNQIADMERSFAAQTATAQGFNAMQAQLAQCCCDNKSAIKDVQYTVATENCADRYEAAQNTRDIIENANRNNQAILDKLCQLELDGYKRENDSLRNQLNVASMQNAVNSETDMLYNRLKNCPVPSMPVYGTTPIFTCGQNCGCGGF